MHSITNWPSMWTGKDRRHVLLTDCEICAWGTCRYSLQSSSYDRIEGSATKEISYTLLRNERKSAEIHRSIKKSLEIILWNRPPLYILYWLPEAGLMILWCNEWFHQDWLYHELQNEERLAVWCFQLATFDTVMHVYIVFQEPVHNKFYIDLLCIT